MSDLAALADGLIDRIETACHERSIWNYEAAEDAEKELARFCAEHKAALLAALRASRPEPAAVCNSPEPAADAVEAMARAMFLIPTPNPGRGSILPFAEQPTVIRNVWLERARAALSALPRPDAIEIEIRAERERQISQEGWTPEHDDQHSNRELMRAAMVYLWWGHPERSPPLREDGLPMSWPWEAAWWKPKDRRRNLVRAGALMLAEQARLDRRGEGTAHIADKLAIVRREIAALPRPEADEGAVRKADEIFDDITRGGPTVDAVMREDWATVAEWMRQRAEDGLAVTRAALAAAQEGQQ